jgi:hypothetical protein
MADAHSLPTFSIFLVLIELVKKNCKAIPVTGHGYPYGCEMWRLPHFLDTLLTDGGEVLSLTRRPGAIYAQEDSWYSFLLEAELTPWP